jgi:hypothetical protein
MNMAAGFIEKHPRCNSSAIVKRSSRRFSSFNRNTVPKVAGTLRVPSAALQKALLFEGMRHMEYACDFASLNVIAVKQRASACRNTG